MKRGKNLMPGMYEITFLPEGKKERYFGSRGHYYEFDDGGHLDVDTVPVWCRRCDKFRGGERIESLEEIDKKLADLDDPKSDLYRFVTRPLLPEFEPPGFREDFRRQRIEEIHKRRQWRERRSSPPKCIVCGSTEIVFFPSEEPVSIPPGSTMVTVRWTGMCSTTFNEWFFTPEGDRIPRDTKPTYWHHPQLDNSPGAVRQFLNKILGKSGRQVQRNGFKDD
jgi:hypothetical protein